MKNEKQDFATLTETNLNFRPKEKNKAIQGFISAKKRAKFGNNLIICVAFFFYFFINEIYALFSPVYVNYVHTHPYIQNILIIL